MITKHSYTGPADRMNLLDRVEKLEENNDLFVDNFELVVGYLNDLKKRLDKISISKNKKPSPKVKKKRTNK